MRKVIHALIVGLAAAAVAIGSADAVADAPARPATIVSATDRAETSPQALNLYATVVRPFGGAVRVAPSSEAPIAFNAGCGDIMPVLAVQSGWVKVQTNGSVGWIGGGRVTVSNNPPGVDCSESRFLYPGGMVTTKVATGCLSLRSRPSRDTSALDCVENGHEYMVVDGPFDPGTGEDWFKVTSQKTGTGWALARHLYPS